jgi:NADH-quinone oxidoreductase subunit M
VKRIAFAAALIEFGISIFAATQFDPAAGQQFMINVPWIASLGISFKVAMDGINILLVLLAATLTPLIILSSFRHDYRNPSLFYALILTMQMAMIGTFVALDGFLFYIFWELALIPIYFICLMWGGENRARITFKFFVYTLFGSLFMLVAFIYLGRHSPTFDMNDLYAAGAMLGPEGQTFVFWCMFLAFAIKMPVFPFHTWQPDTYTTAPTPGTMLLSGIMLKMGVFGVIRWLLPVVPMGVAEWGKLAIILSVIGIVYASCMAIVQKDFKRLIAYSSIAHVGLISAGLFSFNVQGIQGAVIQMVSHGINVVGLFFIVDIIAERTRTRDIYAMGGIRTVSPQFATLFMIVLLGSVALPLTNGFVGEFLLINGVYRYSAWVAAFAGLTVILGAVYMLRSYQSIMLGETNALTVSFPRLTFNEKAVLIPVVILIIAIGVYPKPLLDIAGPAVNAYVQKYSVILK